MNKAKKQKLWCSISKVLATAPKGLKTNRYLKTEYPKVYARLMATYGSASLLFATHIFTSSDGDEPPLIHSAQTVT